MLSDALEVLLAKKGIELLYQKHDVEFINSTDQVKGYWKAFSPRLSFPLLIRSCNHHFNRLILKGDILKI